MHPSILGRAAGRRAVLLAFSAESRKAGSNPGLTWRIARNILRLAGALVAIVLVLSPLRAILAKPNDIAILPSL